MQSLSRLKESPSQTAGPYVHIGCMPNFCDIKGVYPEDPGSTMVNSLTRGERISVTGIVYDGTGTPLKDAMIEIWQADADGLYPSPEEHRGTADPNFTGWGRKASDYATGEWVFETNANDPILTRMEQQNRVQTLIARKTGDGSYRFDIYLQGEKETVFFDF